MSTKTMSKKSSQRSATRDDRALRRGGAYERFMALSPAQRDAEVARYDHEDLSPGKPLTPADRALHRRAATRCKKSLGRPTVGAGAKIVPISIERGLLKKADAYAKRRRLKRSQMVAEGLRLVMQQGKS